MKNFISQFFGKNIIPQANQNIAVQANSFFGGNKGNGFSRELASFSKALSDEITIFGLKNTDLLVSSDIKMQQSVNKEEIFAPEVKLSQNDAKKTNVNLSEQISMLESSPSLSLFTMQQPDLAYSGNIAKDEVIVNEVLSDWVKAHEGKSFVEADIQNQPPLTSQTDSKAQLMEAFPEPKMQVIKNESIIPAQKGVLIQQKDHILIDVSAKNQPIMNQEKNVRQSRQVGMLESSPNLSLFAVQQPDLAYSGNIAKDEVVVDEVLSDWVKAHEGKSFVEADIQNQPPLTSPTDSEAQLMEAFPEPKTQVIKNESIIPAQKGVLIQQKDHILIDVSAKSQPIMNQEETVGQKESFSDRNHVFTRQDKFLTTEKLDDENIMVKENEADIPESKLIDQKVVLSVESKNMPLIDREFGKTQFIYQAKSIGENKSVISENTVIKQNINQLSDSKNISSAPIKIQNIVPQNETDNIKIQQIQNPEIRQIQTTENESSYHENTTPNVNKVQSIDVLPSKFVQNDQNKIGRPTQALIHQTKNEQIPIEQKLNIPAELNVTSISYQESVSEEYMTTDIEPIVNEEDLKINTQDIKPQQVLLIEDDFEKQNNGTIIGQGSQLGEPESLKKTVIGKPEINIETSKDNVLNFGDLPLKSSVSQITDDVKKPEQVSEDFVMVKDAKIQDNIDPIKRHSNPKSDEIMPEKSIKFTENIINQKPMQIENMDLSQIDDKKDGVKFSPHLDVTQTPKKVIEANENKIIAKTLDTPIKNEIQAQSIHEENDIKSAPKQILTQAPKYINTPDVSPTPEDITTEFGEETTSIGNPEKSEPELIPMTLESQRSNPNHDQKIDYDKQEIKISNQEIDTKSPIDVNSEEINIETKVPSQISPQNEIKNSPKLDLANKAEPKASDFETLIKADNTGNNQNNMNSNDRNDENTRWIPKNNSPVQEISKVGISDEPKFDREIILGDTETEIKEIPIQEESKNAIPKMNMEHLIQRQTNNETKPDISLKPQIATKETILSDTEIEIKEIPIQEESKNVVPKTNMDYLIQNQKIDIVKPEVSLKSQITSNVVELPDKVAEYIKSVKAFDTKKSHSITIQLDPQNLGDIKLKVSLKEDRVFAEIGVTKFLTKEMLETQLPEIKKSLTQQNIQLSGFNITLENSSTRSNSHDPNSSQQNKWTSGAWNHSNGRNQRDNQNNQRRQYTRYANSESLIDFLT